MYEVEITPEGWRHLALLSEKVHAAALATIFGPLASNPQRCGQALVGELAGLFAARRGDHRVVYEILPDERVVLIHRVQPRAQVYRRR